MIGLLAETVSNLTFVMQGVEAQSPMLVVCLS